MRRNPSIHITYTNLVKVLENIGMDDCEKLAVRIMKAAVPLNIKDRYIVSGDTAARKKAIKIMAASGENSISAEKFNKFLTSARIQAKHQGVKAIVPTNSRMWLELKEIAGMASEFANLHGLDLDEGCRIYIDFGLRYMKYGNQYNLSKFKFYDPRIHTSYIAYDVVANDPYPIATRSTYDTWKILVQQYGGYTRQVTKQEEYVFFVYVGIEAKATKAKVIDWLNAQFDGLGNFGVIPEFYQLIGETALTRYYTYMNKQYKYKKSKMEADYDQGRSEFEKKYYEVYRKQASIEN